MSTNDGSIWGNKSGSSQGTCVIMRSFAVPLQAGKGAGKAKKTGGGGEDPTRPRYNEAAV